MADEYKTLLDEEIAISIQNLSNLEPGSKERASATEDVAKLYKLRQEEIRIEKEFDEKWHRRVMDTATHDETVRNNRVNNVLQGIASALSAAGLVAACVWAGKSIRFEEVGSITSSVGKKVFGNIFTKLK